MHGDTVVHAIESTIGKKVFEDNETIRNIIDVAMEFAPDGILRKFPVKGYGNPELTDI